MAFELKSAAFSAGGDIPRKFTCDSLDVSPPLSWGEPPAGTRSISLIVDDSDAPVGTWVHWALYDLPASTPELPENVPKDQELKSGWDQPTTLPATRHCEQCGSWFYQVHFSDWHSCSAE